MTTPDRPTTGRMFWPGLIVGLVVMQIGLCFLALFLALRAPGGQVVPDYYRKGIEWDERSQNEPQSRRGAEVTQSGHPE